MINLMQNSYDSCQKFWGGLFARPSRIIPSPVTPAGNVSVRPKAIPLTDNTKDVIRVSHGDTLGGLGQKYGFDWRNVKIRRDGQIYDIGSAGIRPEVLRPGDEVIARQSAADTVSQVVARSEQVASSSDANAEATQCCPAPPWMPTAFGEYGVKEIQGQKHNSQVVKYHQGGGSPWFDDDETPWCASFVAWVMKQHSYGIAKNPARALSWRENWPDGKQISKPVYGAIAVKSRNGGGHVGFVAGKDPNKPGNLAILGGNQNNEVNVSSYSASVFTFMVPKDYPHECCVLENYTGMIGKAGSEQ